MSFSRKQSLKKIIIKILKNKYFTYFLALFTLFFVNEIVSNPNNQFVIFTKVLFKDICLRILTFLAIVVLGYYNITLATLLLINFIFLISVPSHIETFANNLPDLIDKNKILKYQKNFSGNKENKGKEGKEDKEDKEDKKNKKDKENKKNKEDKEENYQELDIDDYVPKEKKSNEIRSPIRIKESEDIEKAAKKLERDTIEERLELRNKRKKKNSMKEETNEENIEENTDENTDNIEENTNQFKEYDEEGVEKKSRRKQMSNKNYEENDDEIDVSRKKYREEKYEETDDSEDEASQPTRNTKKMYIKKQKNKKKKRQELLKELKQMDREERKRVENEKEIDGTIEASLKYKNYDKKLNLRMLEEDTDEDESSSSSESSDSSSSSESSSDSSSKEYEDVSLNEAREHVLNKLRNKIKKKYVKGK